MTKKLKFISGYYGKPECVMTSPEVVMREAFLRTSREILDGAGIESYTLDQIRGALTMLEKLIEIREEI